LLPPESGELSGRQLDRLDRKQKPMTGGERVRQLGGTTTPRSEGSQASGRPTELQFMKQKTALKETCSKAVKACSGIKCIQKQVEIADGKLPKDPAPSFVVPTYVSRGFFCEPFYP